jgi:hypothetical protein
MMPEPSGESKAADEAPFAASLSSSMAATQERQAQAEAFQTAGNTTNVPDVTAGPRVE